MNPTAEPPRPALLAAEALVLVALAWAAFAAGGLGQEVGEVAPCWVAAATAAALAFVARARGASPPAMGSGPAGLALAFLLWHGLAPLPPHDPFLRALGLLHLASLVGVGYATWVVAACSRRARQRLLSVAILLGTVQAVVALMQVSRLLPGFTPNRTGVPVGTLAHHNMLAGYLELTAFLAVAFVLDPERRFRYRVAAGLALLLMLAGAGVAASRAGWISLALGALVLGGGLRGGRGRLGPLLAVALAVAVSGLVAFSTNHEAMAARAATLDAETLAETETSRQNIWQAAWEITCEHPVTGVGLRNFRTAFAPHRRPGEVGVHRYAVQEYLQTSAEGGVTALLLLLLLLATAGRRLLTDATATAPDDRRALYGLAGLASLAAVSAHAFVEQNLQAFSNAGLLVLVVVTVLARPEDRSDEPAPGPAPAATPALAGALVLGVGLLTARLWLHDQAAQEALVATFEDKNAEILTASRRALEWVGGDSVVWGLLAGALERSCEGLGKAEALARLDQAEAALAVYRQLVPEESPGELVRANIAARRAVLGDGPPERVLEILEEANRRFPHDPELQIRLGQARIASGQLVEGYTIAREGLSHLREETFHRRYLVPAAENGDALLAMGPAMPLHSVTGWSMLAAEWARRDEPEQALACWQQATAADPTAPEPRLGAAAIRIGLGDIEGARRLLESAAPLLTGPSFEYFLLLRAAQETPAAALAVTEQAATTLPDHPHWAAQLVRDLMAVEREGEAEVAAQRAVTRFEDSPEAWTARGVFLEARGRAREDLPTLREAGECFREALQREGDTTEAAQHLTALYVSLGEAERAEPLLIRLLDAQRIDPAGRIRLARIWRDQGRLDGARRLVAKLSDEDGAMVVDGGSLADLRRELEAPPPATLEP